MKLQLSKWGNSLAVRLPAKYISAAGLQEGDQIEAEIAPTGKITLVPARPFNKPAFLRQLRKRRQAMPVSESVVDAMRRAARY